MPYGTCNAAAVPHGQNNPSARQSELALRVPIRTDRRLGERSP